MNRERSVRAPTPPSMEVAAESLPSADMCIDDVILELIIYLFSLPIRNRMRGRKALLPLQRNLIVNHIAPE